MTSDSTPSLQETYLNACRSFDELTNKLLQGFSAAVDSALMGYSQQQAEALQRSTGATESQEREIAATLKESLAALSQSLEQTIGENDRFLEHVQEELIINCKSLTQEIADLSESLMRTHNISSKVLQAKLSGQCDKSVDGLQQVANRAKHALREQAHSAGAQFGESLVERQQRQFADLMAYENQARKEIPDMLSAVIARARLHEPKLSMLNRQHNDQIDSRIEQLKLKVSEVSDTESARIINMSAATEQRLRRTYEDTKNKLMSSNESYTRDFYVDVESSSQLVRAQLVELSSTLRAEMLDAFNKSASSEDAQAQNNLSRAAQLSEELQNLIEDQRLIAAQKSTVVAQILDEMKEIETNFENKVKKISAAQLDRLSKTCESSLNEITTTRKGVADKIKNLAENYVQQIEEEEERILKIIERRLDKALGFVDQALSGEE
ncbi:MAG: hypothetical protein K2X27_15280 [Candidatus Obscuribacterales bacterium]|nr:hypothetical protein [Candidatus Obscuribacterales bacterium]